MTERAAASARRVNPDKVGILIGILTIVAVLGLPFVVLRPNRIAAGTGLSVFAALPAMQGAALAALWIVGALWAMKASRPAWRLAAGCA
ncbi:ABC transporter permease, partial [Burkholderia sp. HAN2018]|nr:ABC transporter permease [Burkholderia sp. HAN2018]